MMRLRNQLVIASKNFDGDQKVTPIQITTMSKGTKEQNKFVCEVINIVGRPKKTICESQLRHNVDKSEKNCAEIRLIKRKEVEVNF